MSSAASVSSQQISQQSRPYHEPNGRPTDNFTADIKHLLQSKPADGESNVRPQKKLQGLYLDNQKSHAQKSEKSSNIKEKLTKPCQNNAGSKEESKFATCSSGMYSCKVYCRSIHLTAS